MPVSCKHATAAYFTTMCISHIFPHKSAFPTAILLLFVPLLGFITSTIWLPAEWHHPCVQSVVEQDGAVGFKQFCTNFPPHIWCLCGLHICVKCRIQLPCLSSSLVSQSTARCVPVSSCIMSLTAQSISHHWSPAVSSASSSPSPSPCCCCCCWWCALVAGVCSAVSCCAAVGGAGDWMYMGS